MSAIPLRPEHQIALERFAREHGQTPADALAQAVTTFLEWQDREFDEAVEGVRLGYEDVRAGRTRPATEVFAEMRRKHDLPG